MKKRYLWAAMKLHEKPCVEDDNYPDPVKINLRLPDGCEGMILCFRTKKAARESQGNNVELVKIERTE